MAIGNSPIAIIGGGLSGLSCALALHDWNIGFELFERCEQFGGHARTNTVGSFRFDHGPHVLLSVPDALQPTFSRMNIELRSRNCSSSIYFGGDAKKYVPAPVQRNLGLLPATIRLACIRDYFLSRFPSRRQPSNYRQLVERKLGRSLVDLFVEPYDSKRLTYRLDEIHPEYSHRAPSISPLQILQGALALPTANGGLDSSFLYPVEGGIGELSKALARLIPKRCCHASADLTRLDLKSRRLVFADGRSCHFESLVSSIPLSDLIKIIDVVPSNVHDAADSLAYGSTYVFNIGFDGPLVGPHGIIRYPKADVSFYRLSFPGSYAIGAVPDGCDAVVVEVPYHPQRRPTSSAEALARVHADLRAIGIVADSTRVLVEQTIDIPISHVVHTPQTPNALRLIHGWLEEHGVYCCGKYGTWRELLMPGAMISGQRAAAAVQRRGSGK